MVSYVRITSTKLSKGPDLRQLESNDQSNAKNVVNKVAGALMRSPLVQILACLLGIFLCIAGIFGHFWYIYTMGGFFSSTSFSDPQATLDRNIINFFARLFMWAPVYIIWRKQREYYLQIFGVMIGLLLPYGCLATHQLSLMDIATMETMTLFLDCCFSSTTIFLLPVYVIFVRNGKVEDADESREFTDKRQIPTFAEVKTYLTPCCVYYALILLASAASTAIVHFGKLESNTVLHALAFIAWASFLSCFPLHCSRKVNAFRWLSTFFLVIVPLAVAAAFLLDAYDICSLESIITPMFYLQGTAWIILMSMWAIRYATFKPSKAKLEQDEIVFKL